MSYEVPFPQQLSRVEFVQLRFYLELNDYFDLPELAVLQLRRELLQAFKNLQYQKNASELDCLKRFFFPELPADPSLVKQFQKPAPALILSPDIKQFGLMEPKRQIILPFLVFGPAIPFIDTLVQLLKVLGKQGLYKGTGQYTIDAIESQDASGVRSMLWMNGESISPLTPPINDLAWWLERQKKFEDVLRIDVLSPLRMLHKGRPLFKADFLQIFPFILRRVTGFLGHYGQVDLTHEIPSYLNLLNQIKSLNNQLYWKDWRQLNRGQVKQNLGGLVGFLDIEGAGLTSLMWILHLGSLLNLGKGAAYGAGQYSLTSVDS